MALGGLLLASKVQGLIAELNGLRGMVDSARVQAVSSTLAPETVRLLLSKLRTVKGVLAAVPRTQRVADKFIEEFGYNGTVVTLGTEITGIENTLNALGNEIASRASQFWTGYAINASTWVETVPAWTSAQTGAFQTAAQNLVSAIDTFAARITDT